MSDDGGGFGPHDPTGGLFDKLPGALFKHGMMILRAAKPGIRKIQEARDRAAIANHAEKLRQALEDPQQNPSAAQPGLARPNLEPPPKCKN